MVELVRASPRRLAVVRAEAVMLAGGAGLEDEPTLLARPGLTVEDGAETRLCCVFAMPRQPLRRTVPSNRERPDPFQVGLPLRAAVPPGRLVTVTFPVFIEGEAFEVAESVVVVVVVFVVDLAALGDRPVRRFPDLFVEPSEAVLLPVADAGYEISPVGPGFGLRVSAVDDSSVSDGFDTSRGTSPHATSLSEYRKASTRTHPRPATHTGWSPVPSRASPEDSSTRHTRAAGDVIAAATTGRSPARVHTRAPGWTDSITTGPASVATSVPATRQPWSFSLSGTSFGACEAAPAPGFIHT